VKKAKKALNEFCEVVKEGDDRKKLVEVIRLIDSVVLYTLPMETEGTKEDEEIGITENYTISHCGYPLELILSPEGDGVCTIEKHNCLSDAQKKVYVLNSEKNWHYTRIIPINELNELCKRADEKGVEVIRIDVPVPP